MRANLKGARCPREHEVIAAKLTAVHQGKIRRLIINKPYVVDNM
jgi:hypothetical protein